MKSWAETFDQKTMQEIEDFLIQKMEETKGNPEEMEHALHKIVLLTVYKYEATC